MKRDGTPRVLHSFPTRRSSDLSASVEANGRDRVRRRRRSVGCAAHGLGPARAAFAGVAPTRRSEEHTSELQSHSDLVCRLLLEKKKYENQTLLQPYSDVYCCIR